MWTDRKVLRADASILTSERMWHANVGARVTANVADVWKRPIYVFFHFLFCTITMAPTPIFFNHYWWSVLVGISDDYVLIGRHVTCLIVVFLFGIWNGAKYYMEKSAS